MAPSLLLVPSQLGLFVSQQGGPQERQVLGTGHILLLQLFYPDSSLYTPLPCPGTMLECIYMDPLLKLCSSSTHRCMNASGIPKVVKIFHFIWVFLPQPSALTGREEVRTQVAHATCLLYSSLLFPPFP